LNGAILASSSRSTTSVLAQERPLQIAKRSFEKRETIAAFIEEHEAVTGQDREVTLLD
jgi:hypothetical protein